jgi:phosphatidylinositol-3-phosphatase
MWEFIQSRPRRSQDDSTSSRAPASAGPQAQSGPRLPSPPATAAIAGVVLAASIGLGAALPGGKADSLAASAKSPLSAALLAAIAAERDHQPSVAPKSSDASGATASESGSSQEEAPGSKETSTPAAAAQGGKETSGSGSETSGESSDHGGEEKTDSSSSSGSKTTATPPPASLLSQITHVWVISLSSGSFSAALASRSSDPYLAKQLVPKGTLLEDYSLVSESPTANDVALLSGQGPNLETEKGCPTYSPLTPPELSSKGFTTGSGCVYPATVHTLADQVTEAALTWRAYVQDMAPAAGSPQSASITSTCRHPAAEGTEPSSSLTPGDDYLFARNPFVFFDSLIESQACAKDDVDLSQLRADLANGAQTPNLSWIVPAACDDGAKADCGTGASTGLAGADSFLKSVVPEITATADYKQHGLILIAFDSPASSAGKDAEQVGAFVLSPFVNAGKRNQESFDTYSLLRSLERLFGVPLLGHAADQSVSELNTEVYRSATNTTLARTALSGTEPRRGTAQAGG